MEQCDLQPKDQLHPGLSWQDSNNPFETSDYSSPFTTVAPHLRSCDQLEAPHWKNSFDKLSEFSYGHWDDQTTEVCGIWYDTERVGPVEPRQEEGQRRPYCDLQLPHGRAQKRWSQTLLRRAQQGEKQQIHLPVWETPWVFRENVVS